MTTHQAAAASSVQFSQQHCRQQSLAAACPSMLQSIDLHLPGLQQEYPSPMNSQLSCRPQLGGRGHGSPSTSRSRSPSTPGCSPPAHPKGPGEICEGKVRGGSCVESRVRGGQTGSTLLKTSNSPLAMEQAAASPQRSSWAGCLLGLYSPPCLLEQLHASLSSSVTPTADLSSSSNGGSWAPVVHLTQPDASPPAQGLGLGFNSLQHRATDPSQDLDPSSKPGADSIASAAAGAGGGRGMQGAGSGAGSHPAAGPFAADGAASLSLGFSLLGSVPEFVGFGDEEPEGELGPGPRREGGSLLRTSAPSTLRRGSSGSMQGYCYSFSRASTLPCRAATGSQLSLLEYAEEAVLLRTLVMSSSLASSTDLEAGQDAGSDTTPFPEGQD